MLMTALTKIVVLMSCSALGLFAAAELVPTGFTQLGIAGASLGVLFYVVTRTFPQMVREIMAGHSKANEAVCGKLDAIQTTIEEGQTANLNFLREQINHRGQP